MNDERLESGAQRQAAEWVRALPAEDPSLLWRSGLNERVRAEADRRTRVRRRWLFASPAAGLAAAAALALVVFAPRAALRPAPKANRVEAGLIALHEETVRTDDIVGSGLRPSEAPPSPAGYVDPLDDLDAGVL